MGLNVSKGNMYEFITDTWNTTKGKCYHDCSYCYMKKFPLNDTRFDEKELKTNLKSGLFIFVGSGCDMFNSQIPDEWISKTLDHCISYPGNRYLFQTKNPARLFDFNEKLSVIKPIICTTIETNRSYPDIMRKSPSVDDRVQAMVSIPFDRYVTIEPIMDFDLDEMVDIIRKIKPVQVNIGADSGGHKLPEPTIEKIQMLIDSIRDVTTVEKKRNLSRLIQRDTKEIGQLMNFTVFDFSKVDESVRQRVIERDVRFDITKREVEGGLIEMGRILAEQKSDLKHGQWLKWLESKEISDSTARKMIQISDKFSNQLHVADLGLRVLQMLSYDNVPESARAEAIEKSESGEKLTIKEAKELVDAHRRISSLESDLADAKNQIPTEDVKSKVSLLESQLKAERSKPPQVEVVNPPDYKAAIEEREKLLIKVKKLKESQEAEVDQRVNNRLKEMDDEFKLKSAQIETMQRRIDYLKDSIAKMDKTAGDLYACKKACNGIRGHLFKISIELRDLFEDHPVTETYIAELKKLCSEMELGTLAFRGYLYNEKFIGGS